MGFIYNLRHQKPPGLVYVSMYRNRRFLYVFSVNWMPFRWSRKLICVFGTWGRIRYMKVLTKKWAESGQEITSFHSKDLSSFFCNRITLHHNRFLVNKTNRCTEFFLILLVLLLYMFRQPFCPSSGVLSLTSALVHFMQLWWRFATRGRIKFCASVGFIHKGSLIIFKVNFSCHRRY